MILLRSQDGEDELRVTVIVKKTDVAQALMTPYEMEYVTQSLEDGSTDTDLLGALSTLSKGLEESERALRREAHEDN